MSILGFNLILGISGIYLCVFLMKGISFMILFYIFILKNILSWNYYKIKIKVIIYFIEIVFIS